MTELVYKHRDGQNLAELRNYKLVQGQLFNVNGKNHYRGVAPYPVSLLVGDTWEELDATGTWLGDWFYFGGNTWLSRQEYQFSNISNSGAIGGANVPFDYPVDQRNEIFITRIGVFYILDNNSTATNYYQFTFSKLSVLGNTTTIGQFNTIGTPVNQWAYRSIDNIGIVGTDFTRFLSFRELRQAGTINRRQLHHIFYRRARNV